MTPAIALGLSLNLAGIGVVLLAAAPFPDRLALRCGLQLAALGALIAATVLMTMGAP